VAYELPSTLNVSVEDGVATLTLRRPEKLNAIDAELHQGLADVGRQLARDPGVRVVVLTGEGQAFCVGGDVSWFGTIAADDGFLTDPHAAIGLVAADGGALAWPLMTSLLRVKEYLFTGDLIRPVRPSPWGWRTVWYRRTTCTGPLELAKRLAGQPSRSLCDTKRALNLQLSHAVAGVMDVASTGFIAQTPWALAHPGMADTAHTKGRARHHRVSWPRPALSAEAAIVQSPVRCREARPARRLAHRGERPRPARRLQVEPRPRRGCTSDVPCRSARACHPGAGSSAHPSPVRG
jgi:enoyl-CoA hydratase